MTSPISVYLGVKLQFKYAKEALYLISPERAHGWELDGCRLQLHDRPAAPGPPEETGLLGSRVECQLWGCPESWEGWPGPRVGPQAAPCLGS